ncbi:cytochrome c oxidase accessory protein CcoG [Oceanospirillum linum]|uniref:Cytochrome c oxidase accessory protein CcoG n=1 Tax=Oceanospirillum linum TaxID=966 RepID=A0A1T1H9J1_OCELI|nr:cytochrome c oxidase accessory protein CcoG [Oceanospirillum linum]OOV86436.1 cytochrome c oxidase accessory protein CcoG [Oceanospirillum linum]SEG33326.1 cytochrome c oxidase accessory protein FixG [Oleiphilus messinensis]SMP29268.1 cytochrome c oxidase accessory protein FixG [Oceanospirillum linum]
MQQIPVSRVRSDSEIIERPHKFHVRLTEGRFQNIRRLISGPMIVAFFLLAWLQWNGRPLLLFSFEERRIYLFGGQLAWHDLPLMAGLMIAGACLLFFMAVGWGRVWCGFACPQSIWTWLFIRIEQLTEGKASQRARNDAQPLKGMRLLRRLAKHLLWLMFSFLTALTFTGYFLPVRELFSGFFSFELSLAVWGWLISMALLTYVNAGLVREKICLHACPYSRFQGVMFDKNTQTVSYDTARGEPRRIRGGGRHAERFTGLDPEASELVSDMALVDKDRSGDCIDCTICVQVCPTGIDIRDGLQAACIDCGACIDACDQVMDKIGKPRGLIRFASEEELSGTVQPENGFRPKLVGYGVVMLLTLSVVAFGFAQTKDLLLEVRRDRGALFTRLGDSQVCNHYRIKVEGYRQGFDRVKVSAQGMEGMVLHGDQQLSLDNNNAGWRAYRVCAPEPEGLTQEIRFVVESQAEGLPLARVEKVTTFLTGGR